MDPASEFTLAMDGYRYSRVMCVRRNCTILLASIVVLTFCATLLCARGAAIDRFETAQELRKLIEPEALLFQLDKLLDVCIAHYEDLTTDLLLGVAIANGKWCTVILTKVYYECSIMSKFKDIRLPVPFGLKGNI